MIPGDLKNEKNVLEWLVSSDNRELDDAIEHVNMKMLKKLLQSTPLMAVFFCMFLISHKNITLCIFELENFKKIQKI